MSLQSRSIPRRPGTSLSWLLVFCVGLSVKSSTLHAETVDWASVVSRVADSVVSIQISQLRDFDDSRQGGSNATGFVVDAERGIVLTNRHVLGSGPVRISATFQNQERVDAVPLYRDPVHDFAFFRYDPAQVRFAQPESLPLRPEKVRTGLDIRVIGSDGGEQLSILAGTIARVDRPVPGYGRYGYNDFNTFYLQAASSTSGGSSGSPVIDGDGDVVALNAAANSQTAASFFLPLDRVRHALQLLQEERSIPRGSLMTLFDHKPFRELRRLGLDLDIEQRVRERSEGENGMLVVEQVIPGGAADGKLREGDVLLSINGEMITRFVPLEAMLDDKVSVSVTVDVLRQGQRVSNTMMVNDLHAMAPSRFVELGDSVLQDMSIQHARAMNRPAEGVVVMRSGYAFTRAGIPQSAVITEIEGEAVADLDGLLARLQGPPPARPWRLRFVVPGNEFVSHLAQLQVDARWFGHRVCERVDDSAYWPCQSIELSETPLPAPSAQPTLPQFDDPLLARVAPAMVLVQFDIPFGVDNVYARHFSGVGLVVDADRGLVAVDRNTVPVAIGDVSITFFGAEELPASVVLLHPRHSIALVQYDPAALGDVSLQALELAESGEPLPDRLDMIGYRLDGTFQRMAVEPPVRQLIGQSTPSLARFQQDTMEVYQFSNLPRSLGGPIVDLQGRVHAIQTSFAFEDGREIVQEESAMPAEILADALKLFRSGEPYRSLDARLSYRSLALARQLGLPDDWLRRFASQPPSQRRVVYVEQVVPGTDAGDTLLAGDVLLAMDGQLISDVLQAERVVQKAQVEVTVLRGGGILHLPLRPSTPPMLGTDRLLSWGGALLQAPHAEIARFKAVDFPGVYIADTDEGSPALWDGLYRNRFITAVDGVPVRSLDEFIAAVADKQQDEITRLSLVSISGRPQLVTVSPEYHFWPSFEVRSGENGWERVAH